MKRWIGLEKSVRRYGRWRLSGKLEEEGEKADFVFGR